MTIMKKITAVLLALIVCFTLAACKSNTTPVSKEPPANNGQPEKPEDNEPVVYLEEFPFLPAYSRPMELESIEPTPNAPGYSTAIYYIENDERAALLIEYERILVKNGWVLYEDKKPNAIGADILCDHDDPACEGIEDHAVTLIPQQDGPDVSLAILAR